MRLNQTQHFDKKKKHVVKQEGNFKEKVNYKE